MTKNAMFDYIVEVNTIKLLNFNCLLGLRDIVLYSGRVYFDMCS